MAAPDDAIAFELLAALAAPDTKPAETPEVFLASVSAALNSSDGVDADLAVILCDHLLTVRPHANAVTNARAAIAELAAKRASPVEEQASG